MDFLSALSLPWLERDMQQLRDARSHGKLPHSVLLLSSPGLGAELLANWTAALAVCEAGTPDPCGRCPACLLLRADTHPDYHRVHLEDDAQQIKVDQIRELIAALTFRSYRGGYKVGIVEGAETLNANGANAFLKTLEEPTDRTLLTMIARPSHRLPATIASRCVRMVLRPPSGSEARTWMAARGAVPREWDAALALAGGAPLLAVDMLEAGLAVLDREMQEDLRKLASRNVDVTLLADGWARSNLGLRILWLENWITRRVHTCLGEAASTQSAERVRLPGALLKPKIRALFELLDAARDFRRLTATGMNQQLALEALLLGGQTALGP